MKIYLILISTLVVLALPSACKDVNKFQDDAELCEMLAKMTDDDQRIRNLDVLQHGTQKQKDSLWKIQERIDTENTELLIGIIKQRGWVSKKTLNCQKYLAPVLIFRHSPKELFSEVKLIIDKELHHGRLDALNYQFINDHLNGRPGFIMEIIEE